MDNISVVVLLIMQKGVDQRYMDECNEWIIVANAYMNQIIKEQKHETCES